MLVKQWLREYMAQENVSARSRIRVRYWRHQGLTQWHVFEIAALLPMLLQLSLVLFFAGICVFLLNLNSTVGSVATALVASWFSFYLVSSAAPIFSSRCPYKTPLFKGAVRFIRILSYKPSSFNHTESVPDMHSIHDELAMRQDTRLDGPSLTDADISLQDDDFIFSTIRHCLADLDGRSVELWVRDAIVRRTARIVNNLMEVRFTDFRRLSGKCRFSIVHILIDAIEGEIDRNISTGKVVEWVPWMSGALRVIGSGLLPMFRASDNAGWVEARNRAGSMVVQLFSQSADIARNVLENLSYTEYTRLPSSYVIPEITSAKGEKLSTIFGCLIGSLQHSHLVWANVLNGAKDCTDSNQVNPAQLCQIVLYLGLHVQDNILSTSYSSFQDTMSRITYLLRDQVTRNETDVTKWRYLAALGLDHIERLRARHPGMIDEELLRVLTLLNPHPQAHEAV
ncbi:hypothetical protein NLI96_g119 [Meripilus lineatus]|uniref:DUF6535 domain-containing protein n=1 Tax=Meripilus lineatus TaxID=2056292 RepID=A0AAD5VF16_9APHY|nr:hypothetical protein NLI96_g119 [Physisporinus lineatus]